MNNHRVKTTERGWCGHFIGGNECLFRRNTLVECGDIKIVVSTVGNYYPNGQDGKRVSIGTNNRLFETMAFHSLADDEEYHDADVTREVSFKSQWAINDNDASDNEANQMHDRVVEELVQRLDSTPKKQEADDE